jgi:hypothetical protein
MKRHERTFSVEVGKGSSIIGIPADATLTIALGGGKQYSASVEKVHATLARWHAKANPNGKRRRRRLLTHSNQLRELLAEGDQP